MANGFVAYTGPSQINGQPIVAIVTDGSKNPKTGDMAQLWILPADIAAATAISTGDDVSVCGTCPLRKLTSDGTQQVRKCYVNVMGPQTVWRTWREGKYAELSTAEIQRRLTGKTIRLGAYGDPAALPFALVSQWIAQVKGHTGYTHQWATCDPRWRELVMASVEDPAMIPQGWRAFVISTAPMPDAVKCPASVELGKRTTCARCRLCNGTKGLSTKHIVIRPHGSAMGRF